MSHTHPDTTSLQQEYGVRAADLVICQTSCVSHDAYWRVQDHCKRTGKPCLLIDQPQPLRCFRRPEVER